MNRVDRIFAKFYWVFAFLLVCFFLNEQDKRQIRAEMQVLEEKHATLLDQLKKEKNVYDELALQKESQNDSAWKEIVLMNELGVIPEGFTQVVFE